jgi:hypothetical protein
MMLSLMFCTPRTELASFLYSNLLKDSSIYRAVVLTSLTHSLPVNPNPNPAAQSRVERVCSFLDNRKGGPWIVCVI